MAPPLSDAVKRLMVDWRLDEHLPVQEIALRARCSQSTVYEVLRCYREFGTISDPFVQQRARPRLLEIDDLAYIKAFVNTNPGVFLDEVQDSLLENRNVEVSVATLSRTMRRLAMSRKNIAKTAAERNELVR